MPKIGQIKAQTQLATDAPFSKSLLTRGNTDLYKTLMEDRHAGDSWDKALDKSI